MSPLSDLIGEFEEGVAESKARTACASAARAGHCARLRLDLERSTMADWIGRAAALLYPLTEAVGRHVCAGPVLYTDDITVPVLEPGRGQTRTGRLWAVVRDERPFAGAAPPAAF